MSLARSGRALLAQFSQVSRGASSQYPVQASWNFKDALTRSYATVLSDLKYAKSHEWVKQEGDVATVGISDFAQEELGDIVYVELPEPGSSVSAGETFGVVESVKAASDVYSPITGEVTEVNEALVDEPAKDWHHEQASAAWNRTLGVNSDPFSGGWMFKAKLSDSGDLDKLLDSGAYEKHCESAGDH